jgi:hypothetical protein
MFTRAYPASQPSAKPADVAKNDAICTPPLIVVDFTSDWLPPRPQRSPLLLLAAGDESIDARAAA